MHSQLKACILPPLGGIISPHSWLSWAIWIQQNWASSLGVFRLYRRSNSMKAFWNNLHEIIILSNVLSCPFDNYWRQQFCVNYSWKMLEKIKRNVCEVKVWFLFLYSFIPIIHCHFLLTEYKIVWWWGFCGLFPVGNKTNGWKNSYNKKWERTELYHILYYLLLNFCW